MCWRMSPEGGTHTARGARFPARLALLLLCLALLPPHVASAEEARALYVSPQGDDGNPGTLEAPLQTIAAAQAVLRRERPRSAVVWLRGGVYALAEPLAFSHRDAKNVRYAAYPGETPVVSGGALVTGWAEESLHGRTVWAASAKPTNMLYGEDGARPCARYPKAGVLHVLDVRAGDALNASSPIVANFRAFLADPADLPPDLSGARLRMAHLWKDEVTGVASAREDGLVTLNRRTSMTILPGDRYWFENVLSVPMEHGEWAYDAEGKRILYAPRPGETMQNTALYAGYAERLMTIDGADALTFEGVAFTRTGWSIPFHDRESDFAQAAYDAPACVFVRDAEGVVFENCRFFDTGASCIRLDARARDVAVRGCAFENIGAHAVYVKGRNLRDRAEQTRGIVIEDNRIEGYGRVFYNAPAVLVVHAREGRIAGNLIRDGYYSALSVGWVWGDGFSATNAWTIEGNLIEDVGQGMLADLGGIYLLGRQNQTVIRGNVIRRVTGAEYGGWGIYLDEGADGVLVENNLCHSCSAQGFFQHRGGFNTVRGNILAFSGEGQVGASDKTGRGSFLLEGNLLVGEEPFYYHKYGKETWEARDNLLLTKNPFADPDADDFTLIDPRAAALIGWSPQAVFGQWK